MPKIDNDKYFTPPALAKQLIETTFDVLEKHGFEVTDIIEPSAGNGSFSNQMICTAYDISPESEGIIMADFLKTDIPYKQGRLCIGNPPFGHANTQSVKFFKKCVRISDYIAFIQPISQLGDNIQMYEFDLIYSIDLDKHTYSDRVLHCCYNIYARPESGLTNPKPNPTLKDVTLIEYRRGQSSDIPQGFDYSLCTWGNGSLGKRPEYIGQYATEVYVYVKNKKYISEIVNLLEYHSIQKYVKTISAKRIGKAKLYKYLKNNIEGLE